MQLLLEIESPNELQLLLQYIRLLSSVTVLPNLKPSPRPAETAVPETPVSDFMQYYGILNTGMTLDEIDEKINQTRAYEWERNI